MTHEEAVQAMIAQVPVVHKNIIYKMISGLIYRKDLKSGGVHASVELKSSCGHSVTIARLGQVDWANESDRTRDIQIPPQNEDGPAPDEINAKAAWSTGSMVLFEGEMYRVSALIVRNWLKYPNHWLSVVLSRVSDRQVVEAWSGSVQYCTCGSKDRERKQTKTAPA